MNQNTFMWLLLAVLNAMKTVRASAGRAHRAGNRQGAATG
jgi:hypothetical protein